MLEQTGPTQIEMFPSSWRELFFSPGIPSLPQQTLLPGQIFQLAQPWWPSNSIAPSLLALILIVITGFTIFIAYERQSTIVNERLRARLNIKGNPIMAFVLGLISVEVGLVAYENDIRRRSGYYREGSDLRWSITSSALASMAVFVYAWHTFSQDAGVVKLKDDEITVQVGNRSTKKNK